MEFLLAYRSSHNDDWIGWLTLAAIIFVPLLNHLLKVDKSSKRRQELDRTPCDHGVPGGATLGSCSACLAKREHEAQRRAVELEKENIQRESQRAELEKLRVINIQKLEYWRNVHPRDFEAGVCDLFRHLGYEVIQTPYANDGGKDGIATKDGKKFLIECKRYGASQTVGRPDLQKFTAAILELKAAKGFFVTTSKFTASAFAYKYVKDGLVELIDGMKFIEMATEACSSTTDKWLAATLSDAAELKSTYSQKTNLKSPNSIGDKGGKVNVAELFTNVGRPDLADYKPTSRWETEEITPGQRRFLEAAGVDLDSIKGKGHASKVLEYIIKRRTEGLCSITQAKFATSLGMKDAWSRSKDEVGAFIQDQLNKNNNQLQGT